MNEVIVGAGITVTELELVAVPPGVMTWIVPLVAPVGMANDIDVADATFTDDALTPLTLAPVAPVRFVPVTVTLAPIAAELGVNEVIVGADTGGLASGIDMTHPPLPLFAALLYWPWTANVPVASVRLPEPPGSLFHAQRSPISYGPSKSAPGASSQPPPGIMSVWVSAIS